MKDETKNESKETSLFTEEDVEKVLNDMVELFGSDGELLGIGFQDDKKFLNTFGSVYSE